MISSRLMRLDKIITMLKIFTFLYFVIPVVIILTISPFMFCLWILVMGILFATLLHLEDLYNKELEVIKIRCDKYHERIKFINNLNKINVAINNLTNK